MTNRSQALATFVLASTLLGPVAHGQTGGAVAIEPRSGISFPTSLTPPGSTAALRFVGAAVRARTIFHVQIYAYGLYVDAPRARDAFASFAGVPAPRLARDERFFQRLLDLDVAMALRIVMARDVSGSAIADAFDSALRPRVADASGGNAAEGARALAQFRGYFDLRQVAKGAEIVLSCDPAGRLETRVNGAVRPPIESRALCRALFDIYLGPKPISADGKSRLVVGFADLLNRPPGPATSPFSG